MSSIFLSDLGHTWLVDVDGTILEHNGHKSGRERLLPGVEDFWKKIPPEDYIILLSSRDESSRSATLAFLEKYGIRYNRVIFGLPVGERVLINDEKLSGLKTAIAENLKRNEGFSDLNIYISSEL
ncbi:MAG TPA: hypothetical protein DEP42_04675 [Ruminococcaceae bacterium]|nr:hypothetical protein [Oscillospiraceae bacterium]